MEFVGLWLTPMALSLGPGSPTRHKSSKCLQRHPAATTIVKALRRLWEGAAFGVARARVETSQTTRRRLLLAATVSPPLPRHSATRIFRAAAAASNTNIHSPLYATRHACQPCAPAAWRLSLSYAFATMRLSGPDMRSQPRHVRVNTIAGGSMGDGIHCIKAMAGYNAAPDLTSG
jgi:hypothetical protein